MPAPARFRLAGCALLAALVVAGCGGGGSGSTETTGETVAASTTTASAKPDAKQGEKQAKSPAGSCQTQLGSFVASMDSLRRRLAVGVTYDQYVAEVQGIHSTYKKIPIDRVEVGCLTAVGTPAEQAFNRYIEAANDWGECVSEAGCSSATVEPVLQRRWRIASHFLSEADEGLEASAP
ncbi:MAG TPA: hypothetical protein VF009_07520 [Solirubrobacterales bacterium]